MFVALPIFVTKVQKHMYDVHCSALKTFPGTSVSLNHVQYLLYVVNMYQSGINCMNADLSV